jgi:leucyl-tRNA synthetase
MAPLAPHITEELWERRGRPYSIHQQAWPSYDPELARLQEITLVVQVNGKVRDKLQVPAEISEEEALRLALESPRVRQHIDQRSIERTIYVPGRLINLVVR